MKSSSRTPASTRSLSASVRQLRLLLSSLLAFGLYLSLPSLEAVTPHAADSDYADRLLTSKPFIVVTNDLLRAVRNDCSSQPDDDSGMPPILLWLPCAISDAALPEFALVLSTVTSLPPLPVSTLPGAPRGPPTLPL